MRAEGGRVKLCHPSAEVLFMSREPAETEGGESLDYHNIVALMSLHRSF